MNNKWIRSAIPALLIHISVGTVYCWTTVKQAIAEQIEMSNFAVGWAFSLAIFFLGMSAAFAGKLVEKNIHISSLLACICFFVGMSGTGIVIKYTTGWTALIGIYLFYGVIMGIGLGIGYLTPVKTLMLWFKDNKGLATGISIMGFGLAKAIATPVMTYLQDKYGISTMFLILAVVYLVLMYIGHLLLKKPEKWIEPSINVENKNSIKPIIKSPMFIGIWLMFYLNIHCGLMIISYEKQILTTAFAVVSLATIIPSVTAISNALGRIGYATISDKLKQRNTIYKIIFISCACVSLLTLLTNSVNHAVGILGVLVIAYLLIINAGYGGGFSTLPALLSERFGMDNISQIHGLTLSAWAIAGITGNNMSEIILRQTGNYQYIIALATILYIVSFIICLCMVKNKKK